MLAMNSFSSSLHAVPLLCGLYHPAVEVTKAKSNPICSMYRIFTNIYPINDPNVGKYTSTMEHMGTGVFSSFSNWTPLALGKTLALPRLKNIQTALQCSEVLQATSISAVRVGVWRCWMRHRYQQTYHVNPCI